MQPEQILIADDDEVILSLTAKSVQNMGYSIFKARDGSEAIDIAEKTHPDLFILDWQMPEMDGIEVTEYLRQSEYFRNTPIIMITGTNEAQELMAKAM